jgi:hypothetical protein
VKGETGSPPHESTMGKHTDTQDRREMPYDHRDTRKGGKFGSGLHNRETGSCGIQDADGRCLTGCPPVLSIGPRRLLNPLKSTLASKMQTQGGNDMGARRALTGGYARSRASIASTAAFSSPCSVSRVWICFSPETAQRHGLPQLPPIAPRGMPRPAGQQVCVCGIHLITLLSFLRPDRRRKKGGWCAQAAQGWVCLRWNVPDM